MKKFTSFFVALLGIACFAVSCQKSEDPDAFDATDKNALTLEFDNRVGSQNLALGSTVYKNGSGEEFTVIGFNYFISNITLTKDDGTVVKFPEQYFLIREADAKSMNVKLPDVPAGNYKEVSFMVGVDSTRSVADVALRTGALDIAGYGNDAMYWSWNSGYVFLKMEGTSPAAPLRASGERKFEFHVGGFGGRTAVTANNLRTVKVPVGTQLAKVRRDISPEIHLYVDAMKIFDGTTKISLATTNSVHSPSVAGPIANNYAGMFAVDHVHNTKD